MESSQSWASAFSCLASRLVQGTFVRLFFAQGEANGCHRTNFWVLVNEVFPNEVRAGANSFINMLQWLLNVALALAFPPLVDAIGVSNTFWIFAGIGVLCLIYIVISLHESKGSELGKTDVGGLRKKDPTKTSDLENPNPDSKSVDTPAPQAA